MFRALIGWMDRDWARRNYNPVFAFGQRFVWGVPMFISILLSGVLESFGYTRDSWAILLVFALGGTGMFAMMLISFWRLMIGAGSSDFQERAAAERRRGVQRDGDRSENCSSATSASHHFEPSTIARTLPESRRAANAQWRT